MTIRTIFAVAACILLLAACGGGGGSATVADPNAPPTDSREIRTMVQGVIDRSDTLLMTEQHVVERGIRRISRCSGTSAPIAGAIPAPG